MSQGSAQQQAIQFSVVIPAYNAEQTIEAALQSCLLQNRLPLEIIVVDDASTDATVSLVKSFDTSLVTLILLPENSGPAAARNAAMNVVRGTHIAFLDADDVWRPDKLARMAEGIRTYPDAALWFHNFCTDVAGPPSADNRPWRKLPFNRLMLRNVITPSCAVIPLSPSRFHASMRYCEDHDFWLRLAQQGSICFLPEKLTIRNRPMLAPGGQSSHKWAMRKGELRVYTRLALRQKQYLPLLPFLWLYSLAKHALKSMR